MAVGQNQWYHFGVGASHILVNLSGWIESDVHYWGYDLGFDPWPYVPVRKRGTATPILPWSSQKVSPLGSRSQLASLTYPVAQWRPFSLFLFEKGSL